MCPGIRADFFANPVVMRNKADTRRIALITGAGRRIGRAIAHNLADAGWQVAVHYFKSKDAAEKVVEEIKAVGGDAVSFRSDLQEEGAPIKLIDTVANSLGPIRCLVNNASIFECDTVFSATQETWDLHMGVNLRVPFELAQSFARQRPEGSDGNIINIIDQRVWNLTPDFTTYTLSKFGLWGLTQILARALAPDVRVNGVGPGPTAKSIHQSTKAFDEEWSAAPLKRPVSTEEIALAVQFLLNSPAMTGQMIAIDSGQHLGMITPVMDASDDNMPI